MTAVAQFVPFGADLSVLEKPSSLTLRKAVASALSRRMVSNYAKKRPMVETPDTRSALIAAIMNAMVDAMKDVDGHSAFEPVEACRALSACTALILESSPAIKTPKDMRLASESIATEVRKQLRQWRGVHEVTGQRAWYAVMGTGN